MKIRFIVAMLAGLALQAAATADDFDPKQCMARCSTVVEQHPGETQRHADNLQAIRAQRAGVSDAAVLKQLDQKEEREINRHLDTLVKMCRNICKAD